MKDHLHIRIPIDLARHAVWQRKLVNKYETNQLIKALDTWLVLKHDSSPGIISQWNRQKAYLLQICKCSETIFRHRLKLLKQLGLLAYDKETIRIHSWEKLGKVFDIDTDNRTEPIKYNFDDKQRVQEWIVAVEIEDNQRRQAYVIKKRFDKNPELKQAAIAAMLSTGADPKKLDDRDYFVSRLFALYVQDFYRETEIHSLLVAIRPDTNRSVRKMADHWKAKSPQTVSYWKNKLKGNQVIDVTKFQVQSDQRVRNKHCKVIWLAEAKQTMLCLCDQITLLKPWKFTTEGREEKPERRIAA